MPNSKTTSGTDTEDLVRGAAEPVHIQVLQEDTSTISSTTGLHIQVPEGEYSDTGNGLYLKEQLLDPVAPNDDMIERLHGASVWKNISMKSRQRNPTRIPVETDLRKLSD
jgi:hypothetical protein